MYQENCSLKVNQKLFLGRCEVMLLDYEPIFNYAKVLILDNGEVLEVSCSGLKYVKEKMIYVSLDLFIGGNDVK